MAVIQIFVLAAGAALAVWFARGVRRGRAGRAGASQLEVGDTVVLTTGRSGEVIAVNPKMMGSVATYRVRFAEGYESLVQAHDIADWDGPGWEVVPDDDEDGR